MKDLEISQNDNDQTTVDVNVGEYVNGGHFLLPPVYSNGVVSVDGGSVLNGKDETQLTVIPSTLRNSNMESHFLHQINFPTNQSNTSSHDFSRQLFTETFSEHVSISALPATPRHSCATFCNYETEQHCKDTVHLEPAMAPIGFNSSIICYQNCTKKRFRSTVFLEPRLRPIRFEETEFVRPKRMESRFVSYLDYKTETSRRWYTSSVQINQRACCSNFVRNFHFNNEIDSDVGDDDLESVGSSGFSDDEGILTLTCGDVQNGYAGSESGTYRTKIVVG